ncbi:MAG: hypothetical protein IPK80_05075 [Nannocystis sp.]|nr:hypothetical protein [Nannocystis sp.]
MTLYRSAASALLLVAVSACSPKTEATTPPPVTAPAVEAPAEPEVVCNYLVLIDAGSSGSRALTYQITAAEGGAAPTIAQRGDAKVEPGLASFKEDPAKAAASIEELLKKDGSALATLPAACHAKTPVALMATAGMRLLEGEAGGEAAALRIYDAVSAQVKSAGLDLRFAGTISGSQEAVYGWLSANYALGRLAGEQTVGSLDLGGASAQIAFAAGEAGAGTTAVKVGDKSFNVYAQSYLGYGQDVAREYLAVDACYNKGLRKGTGKYAACAKTLTAVVKPKSCEASGCGLAAPNNDKKPGVAQPAIPAGMKFYAVSNFYWARNFYGLPEDATLAQLREAAGGPKGSAGFCATPWKTATEQRQDTPEKFLEGYCFAAGWIDALLTTMGFAADSQQLVWTNNFGEAEAGWALGAALCSVTGCLSAK